MKIKITPVTESLVTLMEKNGWDVDIKDKTLECVHDKVNTEDVARKFLFDIGLLVSSKFSIDFDNVL